MKPAKPTGEIGANPAEAQDGKPVAPLLSEIIGQAEIVRRLRTLVDLARHSREVFGHALLIGADGSGKRTVAHSVAKELTVNLRHANSAAIGKVGDFASTINALDQGDVLLLTDINRLNKPCAEILDSVMKDFELIIIVGKGREARQMRLAVKPFTLIGTVQKLAECPAELLPLFDITAQFQRYSPKNMVQLTYRLAQRADIEIEPDTAALIAGLADGNPGRGESILRKLRRIGQRPIGAEQAREMLSVLGYNVPRPGMVNTGAMDLNSLSGIEFEHYITEALRKLGFVAEMTRTTGDGGIDIEASLDRPLVGGRYLIQCKRLGCDNLVGSPTVREFYGALIANRHAAKGILITTSGFSSQARDFAANLPIELIDGEQLAKLLGE